MTASTKHSTLVQVVCCLDGALRKTSCTLEELMESLITSHSPSSVLIRGPTAALFLVCVHPTAEESMWSRDEATGQLNNVVSGSSCTGTAAFLCRAPSGMTFAVAISKFVAASAMSTTKDEPETNEAGTEPAVWKSWLPTSFGSKYQVLTDEENGDMIVKQTGHRLIRYLALFLLAILVLSLSALFLPGQKHPWQRFSEVIGSVGPQYQLQLKPENVSRWVSDQGDAMDSKWFLRIDDGAIYPKDLLIDPEIEYQTWLSERYPEVDSVKSTRLYLDEDYLSKPDVTDMLIDKYFHISHCVHSMRRYWVAKETGRHICPMDLSNWHMNHCFEDILIPWALPSGPRGTVPEGFDDTAPYNISWVTRVCF